MKLVFSSHLKKAFAHSILIVGMDIAYAQPIQSPSLMYSTKAALLAAARSGEALKAMARPMTDEDHLRLATSIQEIMKGEYGVIVPMADRNELSCRTITYRHMPNIFSLVNQFGRIENLPNTGDGAELSGSLQQLAGWCRGAPFLEPFHLLLSEYKIVLQQGKQDAIAREEKDVAEKAARKEADHQEKLKQQAEGRNRREQEGRIQRDQAIARAEAARKEKDQYVADLRAGKLPVSHVRDAVLFHNALNGRSLVSNPLVKADQKIYQVFGYLKPSEGDDMLFQIGQEVPLYFVGRKTKETKLEPGFTQRYNTFVGVVGRYVGNQQYRTIGGELKISPVFDVLMIGQANGADVINSINAR
jgi:hypothetical protein